MEDMKGTCIKTNTRKFNSLDLFKLVMAFCVVAIHTHPLENCNSIFTKNIYNSFVSMAVPFFFLTAGFLLGNKMETPFWGENNQKIIKRYLLKMVKLYIVWTAIYFPLAVYHFISAGTGVIRSALLYIRGFIFIGEHYNSWQLWYLLATIYAVILVLFLLKRRIPPKIIVVVGSVLLVISIGITYFVNYEGNISDFARIIQVFFKNSIGTGRILKGAFYIPVGLFLSQEKMSPNLSWIMLVIGYVANAVILDSLISDVFVAISSIGLFGVVKNINLADSKAFSFIRKMSTIIYFIHMYVWSFYYKLVYGKKTYGLDSFLISSMICVIVAYIYNYSNKV